MEEKYIKIERFLSACDELIAGKFILADTKIGDLLKTVASSEELTTLFAAVTDKFDYGTAKRAYLRFPAAPGAAHGAAFLPAERGDVLAFIFCLLVEFDSGTMKLNDFLLRYFYEDGSYTASYALFADRMIRPFRNIVQDCFPEAGKHGEFLRRREKEDGVITALSEKISLEREKISRLSAPKEDKAAGEMILSELYAATGREDAGEIRALLCGYLYFLRAVGAQDANSTALFDLGAKL